MGGRFSRRTHTPRTTSLQYKLLVITTRVPFKISSVFDYQFVQFELFEGGDHERD